jgi:hypothetical protein
MAAHSWQSFVHRSMPPIASHSSAHSRQVSAQAWQASMHSKTSFVAVISFLLDRAFRADLMKMVKPPRPSCKSSLLRRPIHAVPSEGMEYATAKRKDGLRA